MKFSNRGTTGEMEAQPSPHKCFQAVIVVISFDFLEDVWRNLREMFRFHHIMLAENENTSHNDPGTNVNTSPTAIPMGTLVSESGP